jgi:predicted Zn-dependent protease
MFEMYLGAGNQASLTYKAEAQAAIGAKADAAASAGTGAVGAVVGLGSKTIGAAKGAVADVGAGVYGAVKLSIAGSVSGGAKAKAKAGDTAYAGKNYQQASASYLEAYAQSQQPVALYAAAQARAQAGDAITARVLLQGYVNAQPKGTYAKDANKLLLALGGSANASATAGLKTGVAAGDAAFRAGKYLDAAKAYGEAHAKAEANTTLLYARGMAELYAGNVAEARKDLQAYVAASGNLEFKVQAQATLRATAKADA